MKITHHILLLLLFIPLCSISAMAYGFGNGEVPYEVRLTGTLLESGDSDLTGVLMETEGTMMVYRNITVYAGKGKDLGTLRFEVKVYDASSTIQNILVKSTLEYDVPNPIMLGGGLVRNVMPGTYDIVLRFDEAVPTLMLATPATITGVEAPTVEFKEEFFTLTGDKVDNVLPGHFYIVRTNGKARKVFTNR